VNRPDNFTTIPFDAQHLDRVVIRRAIFNALQENMHLFKGALLDVGCGKMPYRKFITDQELVNSYTGLDIEAAIEYEAGVLPDITWDGITMPFGEDHFETALATEVLEHCYEPQLLLAEIYRVLKPGGMFFYTVPFLWPLHEVPYDAYRYTPFSLEKLLTEAGFELVAIKAHGGWHASMAQMIGLWVNRSPMGHLRRSVYQRLAKPWMKYLLKKDQYFDKSFKEGQMITGLYGVAFKPRD